MKKKRFLKHQRHQNDMFCVLLRYYDGKSQEQTIILSRQRRLESDIGRRHFE
jgi:hypothetical protein